MEKNFVCENQVQNSHCNTSLPTSALHVSLNSFTHCHPETKLCFTLYLTGLQVTLHVFQQICVPTYVRITWLRERKLGWNLEGHCISTSLLRTPGRPATPVIHPASRNFNLVTFMIGTVSTFDTSAHEWEVSMLWSIAAEIFCFQCSLF